MERWRGRHVTRVGMRNQVTIPAALLYAYLAVSALTRAGGRLVTFDRRLAAISGLRASAP